MPVVLPRKKQAILQPTNNSTQQRLSAIPRPIKQLVIDNNHKSSGINHASKPTLDTLPPPTPSRTQIKTRPYIQHDQKHEPPKTLVVNPDPNPDPQLAILELVIFSQQPTVNFGQVLLNTSRVRYVLLRNPLDVQQQLIVRALPKADRGINIEATEFLIAPRTEICVAICWTPKNEGGFRESITLQDINRRPRRIILMGVATRPKPEPTSQRNNRNIPRNIPRLFRKSPSKVNRQLVQERTKILFSPRSVASKPKIPTSTKPLTRLISPSAQKRHQLVRKILSQNDEQMAIKVQSYWRMILGQRRVQQMKKAIITLQSYCRAYKARREYLAKRRTIVAIQSHYRSLVARRDYLAKRRAISVIQSNLRALIARREYQAKRRAIVSIQSYCRAMIARRAYLKDRSAIVAIQSLWRGQLARREYQAKRDAIIKLQSNWRALITRREYLAKRRSAITIQSYCRALIARREYLTKRRAIITIQSHFRTLIARRAFFEKRRAIVTLQSHFRSLIARRLYQRKRRAIITIQSHCRALIARQKYSARLKAIVGLQSHCKRWIARREYLAKRRAIVSIQSHCRAVLARREKARLQRLLVSTIWLQSRSRGFLYRKDLRRAIEAVSRIMARV